MSRLSFQGPWLVWCTGHSKPAYFCHWKLSVLEGWWLWRALHSKRTQGVLKEKGIPGTSHGLETEGCLKRRLVDLTVASEIVSCEWIQERTGGQDWRMRHWQARMTFYSRQEQEKTLKSLERRQAVHSLQMCPSLRNGILIWNFPLGGSIHVLGWNILFI